MSTNDRFSKAVAHIHLRPESEESEKRTTLFAWSCCDCGAADKDTVPLHAQEQGKRVIKAICLDCLASRIESSIVRKIGYSARVKPL